MLVSLDPKKHVVIPRELSDEIAEAIAKHANCCGGIALDIYEAIIKAVEGEKDDGKV